MKTPVRRQAGAGGMTKLRAVARLGVSGAGWTESKANCRNELREWKMANPICGDESQRPFCQLKRSSHLKATTEKAG
jgi:hypothetical protein